MTDKQNCLFHPGNAIFHEGIKYWDCCQKKTTDFTSFLDQTGCTKGGHCWTKVLFISGLEFSCIKYLLKPKVVDEKVREDWFQAYGLVHINIYCKGALPDQCTFQTDGLNLQVHIIYGYGEKESNLKYALFGEVMPEKCNAIVNERKVEIILKQAGTESWPMLVYDGASADVANDSDEDVYVLGE
jgi:hypothetical protein